MITEVTVRVRRLPAEKVYEGWRWPSFAAGADAMRTLAQAGLLPTVIRLSDESETAINLARPDEIGADGAAAGCLMITGYEGEPAANAARRTAVTELLDEPRRHARSARRPGRPGRTAASTRRTCATRCSTSACSSRRSRPRRSGPSARRLYDVVRTALTDSLGEGAIVLCHISHVYETGCSLYFTVAAKQGDDAVAQWHAAKAAACDAMMAAGATITHHHAVGTRPPAVAHPRDRRARRLGAAGGQGRPRPHRRPQPGGADPVTSPANARSFTFLVNPASGGGAAPEAVVPVARLLRDAGATVEVTYSPGPKAMAGLVDAALGRGDVIVSVGGDGMLSSLAGPVSRADGTLAVLPAGRGNDFARMLGPARRRQPARPRCSSRPTYAGST